MTNFITSNQITIGMQFLANEGKRGKNIYTVTDILKTYNSNDELVKTEYEAYRLFLGQKLKSNFCAVTIQRGYIE